MSGPAIKTIERDGVDYKFNYGSSEFKFNNIVGRSGFTVLCHTVHSQTLMTNVPIDLFNNALIELAEYPTVEFYQHEDGTYEVLKHSEQGLLLEC